MDELGQFLILFSRWLIGILFLVSSLGKARTLPAFQIAIRNFKMVPESLIPLFAYSLLVSEIITCLFMLFGGIFLPIGFALAVFQLIAFLIALVYVLIKGYQTSCNCFGPSSKIVTRFDVGRNIFFILVAMIGGTITVISGTYQTALDIGGSILIGLIASACILIAINLKEISFIVAG